MFGVGTSSFPQQNHRNPRNPGQPGGKKGGSLSTGFHYRWVTIPAVRFPQGARPARDSTP
eukprot:7177959-Pyramimonas_sp.AAC.1